MSVSIQDCFNLPSLSGGILVAGEKGLSNIVTAVSVLEFDDGYKVGEINSISSHNELLISSFYTIKDNVEAQCESIRYFQSTGNVGLVLLYTGTVVKTVSTELIDTANEIGFPILIFPDNHHLIRYSDIISDVMETVLTESKRENSLSKNILKIMANFPENSRNLDTLLQVISNQKKISLFLCDEEGLLISNGFWPLHTTLDYQYLSSISNLIESDEKITLIQDDLPVDIYSLSISLDNSSFKLMVIDQGKNVTKTSLLEIEEVLSLFTSIYNYNSFFHAKGTLIEALLRDDTYLVDKISKTNKISLQKLKTVSIVKNKTTISIPMSSVSNNLNQFPLHHAINKGQLIILGTEKNMEETFNNYLNDLLEKNNTFSMFTANINDTDFISTYDKIQIAIPYLEKIFKQKNIFSEKDLDFALTLHKIVFEGHESIENYLSITKPLMHESADELLETLSTYYLDCGSEVKATSDLLYVHRNTIQYRFQKTKKILGYDFSKLPYLFDVYISCALHRYFN